MEAFAASLRKLRHDLRHVEELAWVQVLPLPGLLQPRTEIGAQFFRRLFHLDQMMWSGLRPDANTVWINIDSRGTRSARRHGGLARRDQDHLLLAEMEDLFPLLTVELPPIVCLDSRSSWQSHALMALVVVQLLWDRAERRSSATFGNQDDLGRVFLYARRDIECLILDLVLSLPVDCVSSPRVNSSELGVPPSPSEILVALASRIVVAHNFRFGHSITQAEAKFGVEVLARCSRLAPHDSVHHYRRGALLCVLGEYGGAREAFGQAAPYALAGGWVSDRLYTEHAHGQLALKMGIGGVGRTEAENLAVYCASLARFLNNAVTEPAQMARFAEVKLTEALDGDLLIREKITPEPEMITQVARPLLAAAW
jgi:hypothetical protein